MKSPRISVIIPSYNHGRFIDAAVASVLEVDAPSLELIVIDDGSRDDSLERLKQWTDDPRLRLFPQENQGAHAALNRGLDLARGELIFILNSDDIFAPNRLRILSGVFEQQPEVVLACSWLEIIDDKGQRLGIKEGHRNLPPWPQPQPGPTLGQTEELKLALLETNFISTTSNIAFRRLLVDQGLRFLNLRYAHDWDFILASGRFGRYHMVHEPLVQYRVHGSNTIREGQKDLGMGAMRFEILWVVARHALSVLATSTDDASDEVPDLVQRMWNSLPRFGCDSVLAQLLFWRGFDARPGDAYDALLAVDHPFRQKVIELLAEG